MRGSSSRHSLWPKQPPSVLLTVAIAAALGACWLHCALATNVSPVCEAPPDPTVAFPMFNRLLTVTLPLKRDPATIQWAASMAKTGPESLKEAALHEVRHLLVTVFRGKLWIHGAASAWLEANDTRMGLRDVIVELNSPADADHCSHVFQQHLFMAAETHAADTRFDLRQFSDIRVAYSRLLGECEPGQSEIVHFYGALRLDRADQACRGLRDAEVAPAALAADLRALIDRLFFMPSSLFNVTTTSEQLPLLLQSNSRTLAFIIDYRLRVAAAAASGSELARVWRRLNSEITARYTQLVRHTDDYGVARQGVAPGCLNYLNFAGPPIATLATGCRSCYDLSVPLSVNISLSESADIRPPQCETVASVTADSARHTIETRAILASLALDNATAHLFLPSPGPADYFTVRSVSCSALPKRLVVDLLVRLRALHPALLANPEVVRAGLQRNLNARLMARHLGLASVRLAGDVTATGRVDCGPAAAAAAPATATAGACSNATTSAAAGVTTTTMRHRFQLAVRSPLLLAALLQPDHLPGYVRFLHTLAMARAVTPSIGGTDWLRKAAAAAADAGADSMTLRTAASSTSSPVSVIAAAVTTATAEVVYASGVPGGLDAGDLGRRFAQAIAVELQPELGPGIDLLASSLTLEIGGGGNCSSGSSGGGNGGGVFDSSHGLRLTFAVSADLLYGGGIGDYLVAAALNKALRLAGLQDIDSVHLTGRLCRGDSCQVTAMVVYSGASHHGGNGSRVNVNVVALSATLTADKLLRPVNLRADIVPAPQPQQLQRESLYRYVASPYFNRTSASGSVASARLTLLWRLASANASAPLAYRRLPDPPSDIRLRFLLEQLLTDILGDRLVSWPDAVSYKSDGRLGRLEATVALDSAASTAAAISDVPQHLTGFLRLSDLRQKPVRPASSAYHAALLQQSYFLHNFVSNATLQATSDEELQRLLAPKLQFVQAAIFSGKASATNATNATSPALTGFEFRAVKRVTGGVIRVDTLTSVAWRSSEADYDEASLTHLVNRELDALHDNINIIPMVFETRRSGLRVLDARRGLVGPFWCDLLLRTRPTSAADTAVGASWLQVSRRLTEALAGQTNGSHVSVLSLPSSNATAAIDALVTVPQAAPANCTAVAERLMASSAAAFVISAKPLIGSGVLPAAAITPRVNATTSAVAVRHGALLPYHSLPAGTGAADAAASIGDYFCFLLVWGHRLLGSQTAVATAADATVVTCRTANVETLRVRLDPLSDAAAPAIRLSAEVSTTFSQRQPPPEMLIRFWELKNFYLGSNETFIDLDGLHVRVANATSGDVSSAVIIVDQLPPAPPHSTASPAATTATPAAAATVAGAAGGATTTPAAVSMTTAWAVATQTPGASQTPRTPQPPQTPAGAVTTVVTTATTSTPPSPPPLPPGTYKIADRIAHVTVDLGLPSDPWLLRYFTHNLTDTATASVTSYLIGSALIQSLQRSAWQLGTGEITVGAVRAVWDQRSVAAQVDILLTEDRNTADLQAVIRAAFDQSALLSTVFTRRAFTVTVLGLPDKRYVPKQQIALSPAPRTPVTVEHRMLVGLASDAPDFLRFRAPAADGDSQERDDPLLEFLVGQLVLDSHSAATAVHGRRPQLVQYKSDSQMAMIHLRYELQVLINVTMTAEPKQQQQQRMEVQFANSWHRLPQTVSVRPLQYLEIRFSPSAAAAAAPAHPPATASHRGLLIYQRLRLESYVSKKSMMSLPADYLSLMLRPKIEYVMQQVFHGGSATVPAFLDVDAGFTKRDGGIEILALTRVSVLPGFRLSKLEQRLQHHVMQKLEELANDIKLVPSVFNVGRSDLRVLDLKEGLSLPYWCDLVYSFWLNGSDAGTSSSTGAVDLSIRLANMLAPRLSPNATLERLAVLGAATATGGGQAEMRVLVTLSSARPLQFEEAAGLLMKAAPKDRLITRAVTAPFRAGQSAAAAATAPGVSSRTQQLTQSVTIIGGDFDLSLGGDMPVLAKEKLISYVCHLYRSAVDASHWHSLHLLPHSCAAAGTSAISAVAPVRLAVSSRPWLTLPGIQVNITATVVAQTDSAAVAVDLSPASDQALTNALVVKNFYYNSGEIVLSHGAKLTTIVQTPDPQQLTGVYYTVTLEFALTNETWDFLIDRGSRMTVAMAQYLLRDALTARGSQDVAQSLLVISATRRGGHGDGDATNFVNGTGWAAVFKPGGSFGLVTARVAASTVVSVSSADRLRAIISEAATSWPMARRFFTDSANVTAALQLEMPKQQATLPPPHNRRRRRSLGGAAASDAIIIEQRLQLVASPSLPVYFRYQDLPLRPSPLVGYLTETLLRAALNLWFASYGVSGRIVSSPQQQQDWPKLMWLRSDNASVTLCIRYPAPTTGLTDSQLMDGLTTAWVDANRQSGCSLCLVRHQELRRMSLADHLNETVGLLVYQRLQFDGFVGRDTMRKLDHDDLNQLMRHRLHYILTKLYPGGGPDSPRLAGFDFECYGRNASIVTFMLVRLLAGAATGEADLRRIATERLAGLSNDQHVLPAELSRVGADLRLLARRGGLPASAANWFDAQVTLEYDTDSGVDDVTTSLHGYSLAAAARRRLERQLLTSGGGKMKISQLRLMRWKRLPNHQQTATPANVTLAAAPLRQLATVLVTLTSDSGADQEATPQQLRGALAGAIGLPPLTPNVTLPMQDFDHEAMHYDKHHIDLMHSGMAVQQAVFVIGGGGEGSSASASDTADLTSDFICLLLASAYRQRGGARLRLVDDSCAARVTSSSAVGQFRPHPTSTRLIPTLTAQAYYTLHNATAAFDPAEAADIVDQLLSALNAYSDVYGRTFAAGRVGHIDPTPVYQTLRFLSASFPEELRNSTSRLYTESRDSVLRALTLYLRQSAHMFAGRVTRIDFKSGSVLVLIDYMVYPRLLDVDTAAKVIEIQTEAMFAAESPFHGLQLDNRASLVSLDPIAAGRDTNYDAQAAGQAIPVAIYCILGVACCLLLVLSALLLARLIRMRRNSVGPAFGNNGRGGGCGSGKGGGSRPSALLSPISAAVAAAAEEGRAARASVAHNRSQTSQSSPQQQQLRRPTPQSQRSSSSSRSQQQQRLQLLQHAAPPVFAANESAAAATNRMASTDIVVETPRLPPPPASSTGGSRRPSRESGILQQSQSQPQPQPQPQPQSPQPDVPSTAPVASDGGMTSVPSVVIQDATGCVPATDHGDV